MCMQITSKMKIMRSSHDVFEAIVDPDKMSNYWFSSGSGKLEQGKMVTWTYKEYHADVLVKVLKVEQDKEIVISWGEEGQETTVSFQLISQNSATTILEVTESGFREDDPDLVHQLLGQKEGWVYMLTCLKAYLENGTNTLRAALIH